MGTAILFATFDLFIRGHFFRVPKGTSQYRFSFGIQEGGCLETCGITLKWDEPPTVTRERCLCQRILPFMGNAILYAIISPGTPLRQ
jgi:hypothetical protein